MKLLTAFFSAFLLILSFSCMSQPADSKEPPTESAISKKDTVFVPVYILSTTDTVSVTVTYEKKKGSGRIYITPGFIVVRGFKIMDKEQKWITKPDVINILDSKKRPLKNVIQVI